MDNAKSVGQQKMVMASRFLDLFGVSPTGELASLHCSNPASTKSLKKWSADIAWDNKTVDDPSGPLNQGTSSSEENPNSNSTPEKTGWTGTCACSEEPWNLSGTSLKRNLCKTCGPSSQNNMLVGKNYNPAKRARKLKVREQAKKNGFRRDKDERQ